MPPPASNPEVSVSHDYMTLCFFVPFFPPDLLSWLSLLLHLLSLLMMYDRWNPVHADGAHSLSLCLKHNRCKLLSLDLSFTEIGNEGAGYLGRGLESNSLLRILNVSNSQIGEDGASAIAVGVARSPSILECYAAGTL